jgi:hypothetical protein
MFRLAFDYLKTETATSTEIWHLYSSLYGITAKHISVLVESMSRKIRPKWLIMKGTDLEYHTYSLHVRRVWANFNPLTPNDL